MMPGPQRRARQRWSLIAKIVASMAGVTTAGTSLLMSRYPAVFQYLAVVLIMLGFLAFGNAITKRSSGRDGAFTGRGQNDDDWPVGRPAAPWHALSLISRLMPRSAGGRWLAEAESLLSETAAERRSAAIRSYLLSAPHLVVLMWAREVSRRARLGPRRPG